MQISKFISDVRGEMKNVKWPSRKMATGSTLAVIVISILIGGYLSGLDLGLKKGYTRVVSTVSGEIVSTSTPVVATSTASTTATSTSSIATTTATSTKATSTIIKK